MGTELATTGAAVHQSGPLMPLMTVDMAVTRRKVMVEYCQKIMEKGRDYGVIPGTEKKNKDGTPRPDENTLLKPGAEKLCTLFGLVSEYEDIGSIIDFERGLFHFAYKCILLRNAGREIIDGKLVIVGDVAGTGIGSCNSREKKYRRGGRACPECGAIAIKRSKYKPKDEYGNVMDDEEPGWYCYDKAGGCGSQFKASDPAIMEHGQVENPAEAADLVNTIQKMAQKRAKIAATLDATNASEFFTQDLEDVAPPAPTPKPDRKINAEELHTLKQWIMFKKCDPARVLAYYSIGKGEDLMLSKLQDATNKVMAQFPEFMPPAPANGTNGTPPASEPPEPPRPQPTDKSDPLTGEFRATCERIETVAAIKGKTVRSLLPKGKKMHELSLEEVTDILRDLEALPDQRQPGDE